jgi:hypothetical protein
LEANPLLPTIDEFRMIEAPSGNNKGSTFCGCLGQFVNERTCDWVENCLCASAVRDFLNASNQVFFVRDNYVIRPYCEQFASENSGEFGPISQLLGKRKTRWAVLVNA